METDSTVTNPRVNVTNFDGEDVADQEFTSFKSVDFKCDINLSSKQIKGTLRFDDCTFAGKVCIDGSQFVADSSLNAEHSLELARFREHWFDADGNASWNDALPSQYCLWFDKCTFENTFSARSTKFANTVWMANCNFNKEVFFTNAKFSRIIRFMRNYVFGPFIIDCTPNSDVEIIDRANFRANNYHDRFSAKNRIFSGPVDFRRTSFFIAPEFSNVKLSHDTDFRRVKYVDYSKSTSERNYKILKSTLLDAELDGAASYALLYQHRSARVNGSMNHLTRAISFLYDLLSLYGYSIGRPIAGLLLSFIFVVLTFIMVFIFQDVCLDFMGVFEIVSKKTVTPLDAFDWSVYKSPDGVVIDVGRRLKYILDIFGFAYSIAVVSLLSLLALGLKRRFSLG